MKYENSGAQSKNLDKDYYGAFMLFSSYFMSEEMGIAVYNCQKRILNS